MATLYPPCRVDYATHEKSASTAHLAKRGQGGVRRKIMTRGERLLPHCRIPTGYVTAAHSTITRMIIVAEGRCASTTDRPWGQLGPAVVSAVRKWLHRGDEV